MADGDYRTHGQGGNAGARGARPQDAYTPYTYETPEDIRRRQEGEQAVEDLMHALDELGGALGSAANDVARSLGEAFEGAARQVKGANPAGGLDDIAGSVGKAVNGFTQQLTRRPDGTSPYIEQRPIRSKAPFLRLLGGGFLLFWAFIFAVCGCVLIPVNIPSAIIGFAFAAACGIPGARLVLHGRREKRLYDTLSRMSNVLDERERATIADLSRATGLPAADIDTAASEGIAQGLIPHGHLETTADGRELFLTQASWTSWTAERRTEPPHGTAAEGGAHAAPVAQPVSSDPEVAALQDTCARFAENVRAACGRIENTQVRASLERIVLRVLKLSAYVGEHPDTVSQLRRMASYYLPTTEKLANSYAELEKQGDGPQAASTRAELENTFALIGGAFDKFADDLLQAQSWDLKSDIDVMRTMLEQDGLSDTDPKRP